MDSPVVQRFVDALHTVDSQRSTEAMTALVTADTPVDSIDGHGTRRGPEGIDALFTQYLEQLAQVSTTFTRVTETTGRAALEWRSEVHLASGRPATYTGVTVVEFSDDAITSFATVYDSGALLAPRADARPHPASDEAGVSDGDTGNVAKPPVQGAVGFYDADSGFLPEADRDAATGAHLR